MHDTLPMAPAAAAAEAETLPALVRDMYREAAVPLRVKLLECLLPPVGPLALVVLASGAFGAFLQRRSWSSVSVSADDASRISADHLFELARYLQQARPEVFAGLPDLLSGNPMLLATTGSGALLLALRQRLQSRDRP